MNEYLSLKIQIYPDIRKTSTNQNVNLSMILINPTHLFVPGSFLHMLKPANNSISALIR